MKVKANLAPAGVMFAISLSVLVYTATAAQLEAGVSDVADYGPPSQILGLKQVSAAPRRLKVQEGPSRQVAKHPGTLAADQLDEGQPFQAAPARLLNSAPETSKAGAVQPTSTAAGSAPATGLPTTPPAEGTPVPPVTPTPRLLAATPYLPKPLVPSPAPSPVPSPVPPATVVPAPTPVPPATVVPSPTPVPPATVVPSPTPVPPATVVPAPTPVPPATVVPAPTPVPPATVVPAPTPVPPAAMRSSSAPGDGASCGTAACAKGYRCYQSIRDGPQCCVNEAPICGGTCCGSPWRCDSGKCVPPIGTAASSGNVPAPVMVPPRYNPVVVSGPTPSSTTPMVPSPSQAVPTQPSSTPAPPSGGACGGSECPSGSRCFDGATGPGCCINTAPVCGGKCCLSPNVCQNDQCVEATPSPPPATQPSPPAQTPAQQLLPKPFYFPVWPSGGTCGRGVCPLGYRCFANASGVGCCINSAPICGGTCCLSPNVCQDNQCVEATPGGPPGGDSESQTQTQTGMAYPAEQQPPPLEAPSPSPEGPGQFLSPPPPFGFHPNYTGKYRPNNTSVEDMFKSLQTFDGHYFFLWYGHITRFCGWWRSNQTEQDGDKVGLLAAQVTYGNHTGPIYGDRDVSGRFNATCMELGTEERVTQLYAWAGLFVEELGFVTNQGKSHRLGNGGPELNMPVTPPKACLASVSGWTGKVNDTAGTSFDQVVGLQFDWTAAC